MPSVYSGYYTTGTYTKTRVRVDYSGTSATAILLYTRTNTYSGETSSGGGTTFTFGGKSVDMSNKKFYGQQTDAEICRVSFTISTSGGTYSGSTSGNPGLLGFSGSVTIPSQYVTRTMHAQGAVRVERISQTSISGATNVENAHPPHPPVVTRTHLKGIYGTGYGDGAYGGIVGSSGSIDVNKDITGIVRVGLVSFNEVNGAVRVATTNVDYISGLTGLRRQM